MERFLTYISKHIIVTHSMDSSGRRPKQIAALFIFTILIFSAFLSCKNKKPHLGINRQNSYSYDDFADSLMLFFPEGDTTKKVTNLNLNVAIRQVYQQNDFAPIWLSNGYRADTIASFALQELQAVTGDGLNPEWYGYSKILQLKNKLSAKNATISDAIAFDTSLTRGMLAAGKDLLLGRLLPRQADSLWYHANDSAMPPIKKLLEEHLTLEHFRSRFPTYTLLKEEFKRITAIANDTVLAQAIATIADADQQHNDTWAEAVKTVIGSEMPWLATSPNDTISEWQQLIKGYQHATGLRRSGTLDSPTLSRLCLAPDKLSRLLEANMERVRWMKQDPGSTYIIVDVALMELYFRKHDTDVLHMNVVVGKRTRQTPSLNALMANIVLNPGWGVPPTILKQDVLPGVIKSGGAYLRKKGLKAYDQKGKLVNAAVITQKNYKRFQYRQAPGDANALGYVKFNLPNPWDIYLHDTPHRGDFEKYDRAQSSGCIRLHHPQEMALYIFNEIEHKKMTQDDLDEIIDTHGTQWRILKNKIPVFITYLTAFEDSTGSHLRYAKDIYNRDGKVMALLAQQAK
ncbi:MAG: hypothetical protein EBZ77_06620 [Chitinophagia bacterium]|nr:hypothetical protein [Chitinophagia bacterium]